MIARLWTVNEAKAQRESIDRWELGKSEGSCERSGMAHWRLDRLKVEGCRWCGRRGMVQMPYAYHPRLVNFVASGVKLKLGGGTCRWIRLG